MFSRPFAQHRAVSAPAQDRDDRSPFRGAFDTAESTLLVSFEERRAAQLRLSAAQRRLVQRFVEALFEDASERCADMVETVLDECGDTQQVALLLFNPAALLLERQWLRDECDFLQMTIVVSRMQRLFRQMVAEHPPVGRPDVTRCALLVPAPGDQHSLGLVIVDDALTRAGWSVDCASAGGRTDMFRLAASNDYKIIGISVSGLHALPGLASVLARLRRKSLNASVVLMAGGNQAASDPQSVLEIGFDVVAVDARSAVRLAESAVSNGIDCAAAAMAAE
ncbi:MAG: cobalamin B12-binding domain-containing protein [Mesorhizobium sp.]|nr:cobalamin B12-binding domain-containing protein [Mesorhizobium sp.]